MLAMKLEMARRVQLGKIKAKAVVVRVVVWLFSLGRREGGRVGGTYDGRRIGRELGKEKKGRNGRYRCRCRCRCRCRRRVVMVSRVSGCGCGCGGGGGWMIKFWAWLTF